MGRSSHDARHGLFGRGAHRPVDGDRGAVPVLTVDGLFEIAGGDGGLGAEGLGAGGLPEGGEAGGALFEAADFVGEDPVQFLGREREPLDLAGSRFGGGIAGRRTRCERRSFGIVDAASRVRSTAVSSPRLAFRAAVRSQRRRSFIRRMCSMDKYSLLFPYVDMILPY